MGSRKHPNDSKPPIHESIKKALGYSADQSDKEILRDWRERLGRICKPCWELKYCPYGPLVEQSPLLPSERAGTVEHNEYLKEVLRSGLIGRRHELDDERRSLLEKWVNDDDVLTWQALHELGQERREAAIAASEEPLQAFTDSFQGDLPPIQEYRVAFDMDRSVNLDSLDSSDRSLLKKKIKEKKRAMKATLKEGIEDNRRPLDDIRRALFMKQVATFDPDVYPETIPQVFKDGECNIFGHICPVFFAAEAITETSTERRRGRYIPFEVKMRVVRRDNYTCQHCGKHLLDDEVEFDHKIPISKGGSSEEHNVRLTCFDCNRDKSNKIEI
jgi:hypothetical protein